MNGWPNCLLFCPGHRAQRFDKAMASGAGGIVLDLEDGVGPADKDGARQNVFDWLSRRAEHEAQLGAGGDALRPLVALRINAPRSPEGLEDVYRFVRAPALPARGWMLVPKVEDAGELEWLAAHVLRTRPGWHLCALIESTRGLRALSRIAAVGGLAALGFGGADLRAELGLDDGFEAQLYLRARFVTESSGYGLQLLDVPRLALDGPQALHDECVRVRALGFGGKFAIHPSQVPVIAAAYAPSSADVDQARRVIEAFEAAGGHAVQVDGRMVDAPVYQRARAVLSALT